MPPNNWQSSQETKETQVSAEVSENTDGEWKVAEVIPGWPSTSMWGPVVAVLDEWGPPREYRGFI